MLLLMQDGRRLLLYPDRYLNYMYMHIYIYPLLRLGSVLALMPRQTGAKRLGADDDFV